MNLQTKILSLCFAICLTLVGSYTWFYLHWLKPRISVLEEKSLVAESHIPLAFFDQEKNHLAELAESLSFIFTDLPNHDAQYSTELIKGFKSLDIDWLYVISEDQKPLFSMLVNKLFSKSSLQALIAQLQTDYPHFLEKIDNKANSYIVITSEGPALIGAIKLAYPTSNIENQNAVLLVGRFLDASLKAKLDNIRAHEGYVWPLAQAPLSAEQTSRLNTFSELPDGHIIKKEDPKKWRSFSALKDFAGKPQILLESIQTRLYSDLFFESFLFFCAMGLFLVLLMVVGLNAFLNKHFYRPLHTTLAQLSIWVEKTKIKGDLSVPGPHELDALLLLINQVIQVINYHQNTALQHAFNEGLNQMRNNFIKEIKRHLKPLIANLSELENQLSDTELHSFEVTLLNMLSQIPNPEIQSAFLEEVKHRCNQLKLSQKSNQAKIADIKNRCQHLSTLLQAHTLNFEQIRQGESKASGEAT